jgi:hypothetical protein
MAMDLVGQVCAIGEIVLAVHRGYRPVFESGSIKQLMRFLAMRDLPYGSIARVSESTTIPINTIRCWRRELLQNLNWRPDACTRLPEGGALTAQQELDLADKLPADYVSVGQYCPPATVNYLALAMNAESRVPGCDAPLNIQRDDLEYSPFAIAQIRPFRASVQWRLGFLGTVGLSLSIDLTMILRNHSDGHKMGNFNGTHRESHRQTVVSPADPSVAVSRFHVSVVVCS